MLGLAISIPLVIFGSTLLLKVIERFPVIVWVGAALLGFIAGELLVGDSGAAGTRGAHRQRAGRHAA